VVFIPRQEPFVCEHCGGQVKPLAHGTYRNHCPKCLWSKHVDEEGPGDRAAGCLGLMRPESLDHRGDKGWMIVHVCERCGKKILNKTAPDDDLSVLHS
jgi:DNA-directed RNA polymerase subunit RPC12/RpoP